VHDKFFFHKPESECNGTFPPRNWLINQMIHYVRFPTLLCRWHWRRGKLRRSSRKDSRRIFFARDPVFEGLRYRSIIAAQLFPSLALRILRLSRANGARNSRKLLCFTEKISAASRKDLRKNSSCSFSHPRFFFCFFPSSFLFYFPLSAKYCYRECTIIHAYPSS